MTSHNLQSLALSVPVLLPVPCPSAWQRPHPSGLSFYVTSSERLTLSWAGPYFLFPSSIYTPATVSVVSLYDVNKGINASRIGTMSDVSTEALLRTYHSAYNIHSQSITYRPL